MSHSNQLHLPDHVTPLDRQEDFNFACHKGVSCFTECCRMLELALTPYDVLRLRKGTGLSSSQLLERYIIEEQDPGEAFPRFYLTMVDDGRASCVFVSQQGCTVYQHRPGACRTYPLGRAMERTAGSKVKEHFVLIKEEHCRGFQEPDIQNGEQYSIQQGLESYNRLNDAVADILQHETIRKGFIPSAKQVEHFVLALYNLDEFRAVAFQDQLGGLSLTAGEKKQLIDDEKLLLFSIDWLKQQLFSPF